MNDGWGHETDANEPRVVGRDKRQGRQGRASGRVGQAETISRQKRLATREGAEQGKHQAGGTLSEIGKGNISS